MGHVFVSRVTPEMLREYRVWLEGRCRTASTVRHILGDLRNLLYWCEEAGLVDKAPIPRRWLPRLQESAPDRLADDEIARLVQLPDPYGFVIRFGLGTGLRWSEMCRAQASDVADGVLVVSQTKSGKVRRIPLPPDLVGEIRGRVGRLVPYSEKSPGSFANAVRRRSGIVGFHVHQLRHSFGCRWLEKGGSLAALQELMGHKSIVTTQRYARLSDDLVRREVERLASG
jgi:integrase